MPKMKAAAVEETAAVVVVAAVEETAAVHTFFYKNTVYKNIQAGSKLLKFKNYLRII